MEYFRTIVRESMRQHPAADVTAPVKAGMCGIHLGIQTETCPATRVGPSRAQTGNSSNAAEGFEPDLNQSKDQDWEDSGTTKF